jgi:hypothetical protein
MIIKTLFSGEPSMDNPPMVTAPVYRGQTFMFKGDKIVVTGMNKTKYMFSYNNLSTGNNGYMSFKYYKQYYEK